MSKEFYDFIARKINKFFQEGANDRTILNGESFCLKLDDEKMVSSVWNELRNLAIDNHMAGAYTYENCGRIVYSTFTLAVPGGEVIIAAQTGNMTSDFLCATLRNDANDRKKTLLMISKEPIDSAKSGSIDMAAKGMPFYPDQLVLEIKDMLENNTQLTNVEKTILRYELKRRDNDVFSDKTSLFEYKDLLSILSNGELSRDCFVGFRLFSVDGKHDFQTLGDKKLENMVRENNDLFEKIDRGLHFGSLEKDLSSTFEDKMINRIDIEYKNQGDAWSRAFTYLELLHAMDKKDKKDKNPLKIENESISFYGEFALDGLFSSGDQYFIRNIGSQTVKRRKKKHYCV